MVVVSFAGGAEKIVVVSLAGGADSISTTGFDTRVQKDVVFILKMS